MASVAGVLGEGCLLSDATTILLKFIGATSNAAQLAQNAIQIAQLGRINAANARQTISTPLGVFQQFCKSACDFGSQVNWRRAFAAKPDQRTFQRDPNTGYFYDASTGYYYDSKTGFYFNNSTQQWCFWTTKFSTYIPVEGHESELRRSLKMVYDRRRREKKKELNIEYGPQTAQNTLNLISGQMTSRNVGGVLHLGLMV